MRPMAWRVGLFALAGTALLLIAVAGGGRWFAATERAQMRFDSSVFGLQVGAPVVLRGVRVGQVSALALAAPAGAAGVAVPVTAEFDRALLADMLPPGSGSEPALPTLIARGLVARLALQSLLTGQLYVDLDLDPARAAARPAAGASAAAVPSGGLPLIPTQPNRLQSLQAQIEKLDLAQIGQDLAVLARSARELMAGPAPLRTLERTAAAALAIETLAQRLEREIAPLGAPARETLAETRRAMQQLGQGALQVGQSAQQAGAAASALQGQARTLGEAATPLLGDMRRTAEELSLAAIALRQAVAEDSTLRVGAERALQDVSRAARSLRELSDSLERQPDALLRGRAATP